jgi:hypothetical protein
METALNTHDFSISNFPPEGEMLPQRCLDRYIACNELQGFCTEKHGQWQNRDRQDQGLMGGWSLSKLALLALNRG